MLHSQLRSRGQREVRRGNRFLKTPAEDANRANLLLHDVKMSLIVRLTFSSQASGPLGFDFFLVAKISRSEYNNQASIRSLFIHKKPELQRLPDS